MSFYTYAHITADTNQIFYIGKGCRQRAYSTKRNKHWKSIVAKHGFNVEILANWDSEFEAFEHEKLLIASFKDMNYKLANKTDGGEGTSGIIMTAEHKRKLSLAKQGRKLPEETRKKISLSNKGNVYTEEMRAKSSATKQGHKHSEETKRKIGLKSLGRTLSPESLAKRYAKVFGGTTAKKGQKSPTGQCKSCFKIMGKNMLARYHNDKCKLK